MDGQCLTMLHTVYHANQLFGNKAIYLLKYIYILLPSYLSIQKYLTLLLVFSVKANIDTFIL